MSPECRALSALFNAARFGLIALGLNIVLGQAGLLDLGYVGFFAIGSYATAVLTSRLGFDFWTALALAGLLSGLIGLMLALPALRVSGPYLAMITIAFAFVIEHGAIEWRTITGGAKGAFQVGAERVLREELGFRWKRVFGVSVGALNGALLAQLEYDRLLSVWQTIREQDVYRKVPWPWLAVRLVLQSKPRIYDHKVLRETIAAALHHRFDTRHLDDVGTQPEHRHYRRASRISTFMSATAAGSPLITAWPIIAWPMFSSCISGSAAIGCTL